MLLPLILLVMLFDKKVFGIASTTPKNNYGPFKVNITQFQVCKGPKSKECAILKTSIASGNTRVIYDVSILENMSPNKGKVISTSATRELMRMQMNKPCTHPFIMPFFKVYFNITNDCIIKKGHYHFDLDMQEVIYTYYGKSFLYGTWTFKTIMYGNNCNFLCTIIDVAIQPL